MWPVREVERETFGAEFSRNKGGDRGEWDPDGGGTPTEELNSKRPSHPSARHRALQRARADQSGCRGPCGVYLEVNFGRLRCAWVQLLQWDTLRQPRIA